MIRYRFIELCSEAEKADASNEHMNCRVMEPYFQKIIDLGADEGHKEELLSCFRDVIDGIIAAPYEMLSYCMRGLRYKEVETYFKDQAVDPRQMNLLSDVIHAINDNIWEDADLWEYMT